MELVVAVLGPCVGGLISLFVFVNKKNGEFQLSNSNCRRVTDLAPLVAFGVPRDVNSTMVIKGTSKRSMNFNSRIRIAVA